jgi:hypothetical protein
MSAAISGVGWPSPSRIVLEFADAFSGGMMLYISNTHLECCTAKAAMCDRKPSNMSRRSAGSISS